MVKLSVARNANRSLKTSHEAVTAVFVGATSGIGKATLRAFAQYIPKPRAFIVGRSLKSFEPELAHLRTLNPAGEFHFFETDVSRIANIDTVSREISSSLPATQSIDLLIQSQGYLSFDGREQNADGLDNSFSLRYYGRVRFAENLLPRLAPRARVLSILAGGQEGKIFEDDLDLEQNYSLGNAANQSAAMMTLSWDKLAEQNPDKTFLHIFPGFVSTGLLGKSATGVFGYVMRYVIEPFLNLFITKPEVVGERMLHYVTRDSLGAGSWSLDADGSEKETEKLKEYRSRGLAGIIAKHNASIFDRVGAK